MIRVIFAVLIGFVSGCAESNFRLSEESRLPYFFEIADGKARQDYTVTASYYIWPTGSETVLKLKDEGSWFGNKKITAKKDGDRPIILKGQEGRYPSYGVIRYNGMVDVIEHRGMNDIFYMTDDPRVWKELGLDAQ